MNINQERRESIIIIIINKHTVLTTKILLCYLLFNMLHIRLFTLNNPFAAISFHKFITSGQILW